MDNYQIINQISIIKILDVLNIGYKIEGSNIRLIDKEKLSDGWIGNLKGNYINDFSLGERAVGGTYNFVKSYLKLDPKQTFEWFRDNFYIEIKFTSKKRRLKNRGLKKMPVNYTVNW